jgi:hypothetical protein
MAGTFAYHLALVGLLLVLSINLMGLMIGTGSDAQGSADQLYASLGWLLNIALGGYAVGLLFLFWSAWRAGLRPDRVEMILLAILPLAIPITFALPFITWKWPVSEIYGIPALWVIPETIALAAGLAWLLLSAWLLTRRQEMPASTAPVPQLV